MFANENKMIWTFLLYQYINQKKSLEEIWRFVILCNVIFFFSLLMLLFRNIVKLTEFDNSGIICIATIKIIISFQ